MAQGTFEAQVEGMTSLTISSSGTSPLQSELTDYLVDGVRDVACRVLAINPEEAALFSRTATENDANGLEIQSGIVVGVVRANGDDATKLNPADRITSSDRFRAKDPDSLHFRSKYNPAYYISGKTVFIIPDPADNSNKDDAKVTYVDYDTGVLFSDATGAIDYFPDKYQGLVVQYAACRSLLNAMGNAIENLTAYVAPVISDSGADLTTMTDSNWTNLDFDFDDENIDYKTWFQAAGDMIQRQEDFELAGAQLEKISTYITAYQTSLANSGAVFDKNFQKFTSDYQWMADRHQRLYAEYIGYFNTMQGQKQQMMQQAAQAQESRRG
jgi:hypothetical protein|tara:strand:- start:1641 stop:2621 length:981 start_codon:yes stop_codon:yes gene_type:complete